MTGSRGERAAITSHVEELSTISTDTETREATADFTGARERATHVASPINSGDHFRTLISDPLASLNSVVKWLFGLSIVTVVIPGLIAAAGGFFYEIDTNKLSSEVGQLIKTIDVHAPERERIDAMMAQIDRSIETAVVSDIGALVDAREKLRRAAVEIKSPVKLHPFYMSPQMLLYLVACLGLATVHSVLLPRVAMNVKQLLGTWFWIILFFRVPIILRNWPFRGSALRRVFTYAQYDVHRASWIYQEGMGILFSGLAAALLVRCAQLVRASTTDAAEEQPPPRWWCSVELERVANAFIHWVVCSVVLAAGFLWFTLLYWRFIGEDGDTRYLPAAITVHVLWGLIWTMVSLPFAATWRRWSEAREECYAKIATSQSADEVQRAGALLQITPLRRPVLVLASAGAVVTFFLPLLNLLR